MKQKQIRSKQPVSFVLVIQCRNTSCVVYLWRKWSFFGLLQGRCTSDNTCYFQWKTCESFQCWYTPFVYRPGSFGSSAVMQEHGKSLVLHGNILFPEMQQAAYCYIWQTVGCCLKHIVFCILHKNGSNDVFFHTFAVRNFIGLMFWEWLKYTCKSLLISKFKMNQSS